MRTLALAFFWAALFGGTAWAAAQAVSRWADRTCRRHANAALTPERLAQTGHKAPRNLETHANEALELVVQGQVADVLRAAEAIKRGATA